MTDIDDLVRRFADRHAGWIDRRDLLDQLKADGHSIIPAIRILRTAFDIPLREAKELCVTSGLWADQVEAAQPLHEELERRAADCNATAARDRD